MTALAADRDAKDRDDGVGGPPLDVAASTTLYGGSLLSVDSSGNVIPAADTAATIVVGVCPEKIDNSSGSAGDKTVSPLRGHMVPFEIQASSLTKADIGKDAVVQDDQTLTDAATATNDIPAGVIVGIEGGEVYIIVGQLSGTNAA